MNRFFLLATLIVSASCASAAQLTSSCTPVSTPATASGGTVSTCSGTGLVPGGAVVNSITWNYSFDIETNLTSPGSPSATFSASISGTTLAVNNVLVSFGTGPVSGPVSSVNIANDRPLLELPFNVNVLWSANVPPVTTLIASFGVVIDYTPLIQPPPPTPSESVPEPATVGLVSSSLAGLAFLGYRRRKSR